VGDRGVLVKAMKESIYAREPLNRHLEIPVFSEPDEYTENYEKISQDHLEFMNQDGGNPWIDDELWTELESSTARLIEKYSQPDHRILDVGVGLGRLMSHFPQLRRYGMDISFGYLEIARTKGIEVCYARVEDMPYRAGLFDVVVATDMLEHVPDLNLSCTRMLHALKPGGVLIVRVPYREDLSPYLAPEYPYKYVHLRNFDEPGLRLFFERIMNCDWLEVTKTGIYLQDNSRLKYRSPKGEWTLIKLLKRMDKTFPSAYQKLKRRLVLPMEINVVVKKK
jgi:2-polyprenyl-3-methyl-5-hydroxy-6-metoxy-1,4-benzoquinol methylase